MFFGRKSSAFNLVIIGQYHVPKQAINILPKHRGNIGPEQHLKIYLAHMNIFF